MSVVRIKEHLLGEQADLCDGWMNVFYPGIEKGSQEWHLAKEDYLNFREWENLVESQAIFAASLISIRDRYLDASEELKRLRKLNMAGQPDIVRRMSFAHSVTVMDSFLMYSARALLNYPSHLNIFLERVDLLKLRKVDVKRLRDERWVEQEPEENTPRNVFRQRAQAIVSQMTFQSRTKIEHYFSTLLQTPHSWPLAALEPVITTRNDLVHRNGINVNDEPVFPGTADVDAAIGRVTAVIDAATSTLLQEESLLEGSDVDELSQVFPLRGKPG